MAAITFFTQGPDGRYAPTKYARSLWAPRTLNGPAICAIAAETAEAEAGHTSTGLRPARFTIDLFKAAREVPTLTRSRVVRDGRRIRVVDVEVLQFLDADAADAAVDESTEPVLVARATTVFLRPSTPPPGQRWQPATQDDFPRPPATEPGSYEAWFGHDKNVNGGLEPFWDNNIGSHQNAARKRMWTVPIGGVTSPPSPFVRSVTGAEATSLMGNWGSSGIGFINCDLTVTLARLPVGDRVGLQADTHLEADGISTSTSGLFDEQGRFGTGIVTAVNNAAAEIDFTAAANQGPVSDNPSAAE